MKKILSTLCMALMAVAMMAQEPVITFEKTEHDFGKVNEGDGRVSTVFTFKNEGMSPLVLSNVKASCGCTTPTWTKEPIEPGQSGSITVTYNPKGRPGRFQKTVTITSNASEPTKKVYIKGEVIPEQAKPANKFTVALGELSVTDKEVNFGNVAKGSVRQVELEYANLSKEAHTVAVQTAEASLSCQATLEQVQPNEIGKFIFVLDSKSTKQYGPNEWKAYALIDGKKARSVENELTIKATIVEDFSQLTLEEKQQAPILEVAERIDLGKIAAGKVLKGQLELKNIGVNPLLVRRAYTNEGNPIVLKPCKSVKSGKVGHIGIEVNTKGLEPGQYIRQITLYTNDYAKPQQQISVLWTIE